MLLGNVILDEELPTSYNLSLIDLKGHVIFSKSFKKANSSGLADIFISTSGSSIAAILISPWLNDQLNSWNPNLIVWNKDGKLLNDLRVGVENGIIDLIFHPKNESYLVIQKDQYIFSTDSMNLKRDIFNDANKMNEIKYSPTGQYVLTAGTDNFGKIWETNGTLNQKLVGHTLPMTGIDIDQKEQKAITLSSDGTIKSWIFQNTNSGLEFEENVKRVYNDPTRNFLFLPNNVSGSKIYDLRSNLNFN